MSLLPPSLDTLLSFLLDIKSLFKNYALLHIVFQNSKYTRELQSLNVLPKPAVHLDFPTFLMVAQLKQVEVGPTNEDLQ